LVIKNDFFNGIKIIIEIYNIKKGGLLSLFVGAGIYTLLEFLELFWDIVGCIFCCNNSRTKAIGVTDDTSDSVSIKSENLLLDELIKNRMKNIESQLKESRQIMNDHDLDIKLIKLQWIKSVQGSEI